MGLGLGLCCCCSTCGGLFDPAVLATMVVQCNLVDASPTTADPSTHGVLAAFPAASIVYESSISTPTVQVFSRATGAIAGINWRATLRLEDGAAPVLSFVHNDVAPLTTAPTLSADYVGDLGGLPGVLFVCTKDGWTRTAYTNPTVVTRFYQLTTTDGCTLGNVPGSISPWIGTPDSWCCPNRNMSANGGADGCAERTTLPDECVVTIEGFSDNLPDWTWSQFNGTFTLSKTAELYPFTGPAVLGTYVGSDIVSGGCTYRYSALITAPDVGVASSQCNSRVTLSRVSGACTAAGEPFYQIALPNVNWDWMQLGCQFGRMDNTFGSAITTGAPFPIGGPTNLTWAAP